jgi:nitrite reductase (NADH) small subunit
VARWVRLCGLAEAPPNGELAEAEAEGVGICLANLDGELAAVDNRCPHRGGPLGQGWLEGDSVVCPWHSWTFDLRTGVAEFPVRHRQTVFPLRVEGDEVLVDLEQAKPRGEEFGGISEALEDEL